MWFIGVEVEQEMSAPPPKKNPGSAPVRGGSRGRVQGVHTLPEMTYGFLIQLVFCRKKKLCGLLVLK